MTTKEEVETWKKEAQAKGAEALIIVCDTFDHGDYPVAVMPGADLEALKKKYSTDMQRIMEVIMFPTGYCANCGFPFYVGGSCGCAPPTPHPVETPPDVEKDPFDTAKYYDIGGHESLTHEDPDSAIQESVGWAKSLAELKKWCPVTVTAYLPEPPDDKEKRRWADVCAETFLERFYDEYGDPENGASPEEVQKIEAHFLEATNKSIDELHVWRCKDVATKNYSYEEVIKVMEDMDPEWLQEMRDNEKDN